MTNELTWTTLTRGWNWKSGDWTIDRRVTDRGTEFVIFHGNIPEEITGSLASAKGFVVVETRRAALRATRQKIEALDAELRRADLDPSTRASLIGARIELTTP